MQLWYIGVIIEGPVTTIVLPPVDVVQFNCTHIEGVLSQWAVNNMIYSPADLANGELPGHGTAPISADNATGNAILVFDVVAGDSRNGSEYICVVPQMLPKPDVKSNPAFLIVAGT